MSGGNGEPVLHIEMKFFKACGSAGVQAEQAEQAPAQAYSCSEPSAPPVIFEQAFMGAAAPAAEAVPSETPAAGVPSSSACGSAGAPPPPPPPPPPPTSSACGSAGVPGVPSSSAFWIDLEIIERHIGMNGTHLQNLGQMQTRGVLWPLPTAASANYVPLGVGWSVVDNDWPEHLRWDGCDIASFIADHDLLEQASEAMASLAENRDHAHWCEGVRVCSKFLLHAQALHLKRPEHLNETKCLESYGCSHMMSPGSPKTWLIKVPWSQQMIQAGTMCIGPMIACNVIMGTRVAYNPKFQTWMPDVPEHALATAFFGWIPIYLAKIKFDLMRAGVWERKYL